MSRPQATLCRRVGHLLLLWCAGLVPGIAFAAPATSLRSPAITAALTMRLQPTRSRSPKRAAKRPVQRSTKKTPARRPRVPAAPALRYTTPRGSAALTGDLGALLGSRTRSGTWGAVVVSITRGDTLFARGADERLVPASTMKLFTSAIALEKLGAEHAFRTEVLRTGTVDAAGTLNGDLILRGDGDPSLSSRFVRGGPNAPMTMLAQFTAGAGIKRITGDLIADGSAFESRRIPDGWLSRYAGAGYAAPFAALSLNENIMIVGVTPGANGGAARVFIEPATTTIAITSTVRTVAGGGSRISARRVGDDRVIVSGTIGARAGTVRYQLVVGDPVTFTAGAFRAALEAQGIPVGGQVKAAVHRSAPRS